jgi:dihydroxy-acid dehydratase
MGYSEGLLAPPIVGIGPSSSDFNNCYRDTPKLVEVVRGGVLASGGLH